MDRYPIVVLPLEDNEGGGFLALAPDLQGCMGDGETYEAAVADLEGAIAEWLNEAKGEGLDIPEPGAHAKTARNERDELFSLLRDHMSIIEDQAELIERLEKRVAHARTTASTLIARDRLERIGNMSGELTEMVVTTFPSRRTEILSH